MIRWLKRFRGAGFWRKVKQQAKLWREVALPGASIVALVMIVRLAGFLQSQEWMAFDSFLRLRPPEAMDTRVVILGIDEDDIDAVGQYPIPHRDLAKALRILTAYQPRVIGLDLFRGPSDDIGRAELSQAFQEIPNIVGIEVALNEQTVLNTSPPPELPPNRVGFADVIVDSDGKLRRSILAAKTWGGELKYSLPFQVSQVYLQAEGASFQHGPRSTDPIRLGSIVITRFLANSGGYVRTDANGNQVLLNFRSRQLPFHTISLSEVLDGKVDPSWIRDHVVLIGMTAASVKDMFITSAVKSTLLASILGDGGPANQVLYGVEAQAHTVSQIISAVLNGRPFLNAWPELGEYLWILFWGLLGVTLGILLQSPWKTLLSIAIATLVLIGGCYTLLILGWWIPVVPTVLALWGAGLTTAFFDRDLRALLEQRSLTLKRSFDAVHNGPLQNLAVILRSLDDDNFSSQQLRTELQSLNRELRGVYESMKQEMLTRSDSLYLEGNLVLDLNTPIPELLYQVYELTLSRNFPCFVGIKTYIPPNFKTLEDCPLNLVQKRGLCLFLQESLCNVGKHALAATRLDVSCTREQGWYSLRIVDNGAGISNPLSMSGGGRGTDQSQELARQLGGKFQRLDNSPQGTICELTWPTARFWFWRF